MAVDVGLVRSEKDGHHAYIKKWVLKKMDKDMLIAAAYSNMVNNTIGSKRYRCVAESHPATAKVYMYIYM